MTATALTDPAETRAVLVPCYGFDSREQADTYIRSQPPGAYLPFSRGNNPSSKLYCPISASNSARSTNHFLDPEHRDTLPRWIRLRDADKQRPDGSYNVALMMGGPRQYYLHSSSRGSRLHSCLMSGLRDCYVAWQTSSPNGSMKSPVYFDGATGRQIHIARSGRGAIYSESPVYDRTGTLQEYRVTVVLVEFGILDRTPEKGDAMKIVLTRKHCWLPCGQVAEPHLFQLEDKWSRLLAHAIRGFRQHCRAVPEELERWRVWFLDQEQKAAADRRIYGEGFGDAIGGFDWRTCLDAVEEAWQLEAVIRAHAHHPRFYPSPAYPGANYSRVRNMLSAYYRERPDRREAFEQMLTGFVIVRDNLWNYTGD